MSASALDDFARATRAFCAMLEKAPSTSELIAALAGLLVLAEALPDLHPEQDAPEAPTPPTWVPTWVPVDYYLVALDPLDLSRHGDFGTASLVDDLMDIRSDLLRGLWLYDHGFAAAACFEWRESYQTHWGEHATGALSVLVLHRSRG